MLIEEFLKYLQYEKKYSTHTVFAYERDLNQFISALKIDKDSGIPDIESADIRYWISELMDEGLSPKSVNRKLSTLKSFFKFLQRKQHLVNNPVLLVSGPSVSKRLPRFVRESELDNLLNCVDFGSGFEAERDKFIIELLYGTGIRLSELIGLKINDVDLSAAVIKVTGKRNKQRLIPLNNTLLKTTRNYLALKQELFGNNNNALFVTVKGAQTYPKLIYRIVKKYLTMVTTQSKKSPHVLRHSFATVLLNKGADINIVKTLLGHANLSATEVYTHNTFDELKKVYNEAHPRA